MSSERVTGTGAGVRIAIIDSGVHPHHPHVGGVSGGVGIAADGTPAADYLDRLGHGTAVASAIREKAPAAELYAVRIFDRSLSTSVRALVAAIDWAVGARVHIVNLSLGTANPGHQGPLQQAVERAVAAGVLIVAARDDGGTRWWPGSLAGVLPVRADAALPRAIFEIDDDGGVSVCRSSPYPRPIPGVPPERNLSGISFAVANVTGFLAQAVAPGVRGCTLPEAWQALAARRAAHRQSFAVSASR